MNNDYEPEASGLDGCRGVLTAMAICLLVIVASSIFYIMNTLHQLSFLYPNAVAVAGILIAFAVIYFAGKALAWVFSSTEKKVEHEPSVLTELDELRRSNDRLSTMYDQLAYDHDVLGNEYKKLLSDFLNARKSTRVELLQSLNDSQSQSYNRMIRIAELEKELSNLRSSCDDSFLNTVDRANKLSMKCASLENIIAEFDVYKKDAQEVHDKLTKLYESEQIIRNNLSSKLWRSRREVVKLKRDLISATAQIAELGEKYRKADKDRADYEDMYVSVLDDYADLKVKLNAIEQDKPKVKSKPLSDIGWANWIATDIDGAIYAYDEKPIKMEMEYQWYDINTLHKEITSEQSISLCGRIPEWSDEEPTPVINK